MMSSRYIKNGSSTIIAGTDSAEVLISGIPKNFHPVINVVPVGTNENTNSYVGTDIEYDDTLKVWRFTIRRSHRNGNSAVFLWNVVAVEGARVNPQTADR